MPGRPEFTIHTPAIVTIDDILNERRKIDNFFVDKWGYFTFDLSDTSSIQESGLIGLAKIAHRFEQQNANLQFVRVDEEAYPDLMNTNIGSKRLISLAEIYAGRSQGGIRDFMEELISHATKFGVTETDLREIGATHYDKHKGLHGSYAGVSNYSEMMQRRTEYQIILAQRLIEDNKPDVSVLDHLGYRVGDIDRIRDLSQIPDMLKSGESSIMSGRERYDPRHMITGKRGFRPDNDYTGRTSRERSVSSSQMLEEGVTYEGKCSNWNQDRGFGFLKEDSTSKTVFVHFRQIQGDTQLRPGKKYSFHVYYEPGKPNPEGRNVTPLGSNIYRGSEPFRR